MNIAQKIRQGGGELTAAIDECSQEATAKAVHRVRTRCRRLEAVVSAVLVTHPGQPEFRAGGAAVVRRLKKIRRGAGAVRDLDIHLALIEGMLEDVSGQFSDGAAKDLHGEAKTLDGEAKALHRKLTRERKRAAVVMLETTDKHKKKLEKRAAQFLKVVEELPASERQLDTLALATAGFLKASAAMPALDAANLHDFRKRLKMSRYIAESNPRSPESVKLAKKLVRVQDAIGKWHDWDALMAETQDTSGKKGAALLREIDARRASAYREALKIARETQQQMLRRAS